ncbi:hypothetical protein GTP91_09975 [Rugamonas sp. FT82W]|uniref:Uncharacterized protein n=1 Tax=Duganella vulcania TaxID=2692166 RepID=A0A845G3A0_9BURK|nr:hypothetical protein [Duganella vulcania]MYM87506.1 hypothetical protein [Duganella vulcania]
MHEPAAVYGMNRLIFDRSLSTTQNVIMTQGATALSATINRINNMYAILNTSVTKGAYIGPEIASILSDLCYQAGLASTILFNNKPRRRLESEDAFKLRAERAAYVENRCQDRGINISILNDTSLRNSLTHIDEQLTDALRAEASIAWCIDLAIDSRNYFSAPDEITVKYCRCFIKDENSIVHQEHTMSVVELRNECKNILSVIFGRTDDELV